MANTESSPLPEQPLVATAGGYYRRMRYILVLAILFFAAYFAYDGWKAWPEANRKIAANNVALQAAQKKAEAASAAERPAAQAEVSRLAAIQRDLGDPHDEFGILNQKRLAVILPFIALGYLAWMLRSSRGDIRLENDVLQVPGHPPVKIDDIESIDNSKWERKGIALLHYQAGGAKRTIKLDDFVYTQKPIDGMYEIIAKRHGVWKELGAEEAEAEEADASEKSE